jgi:type IV pilus assembly protein PilQ
VTSPRALAVSFTLVAAVLASLSGSAAGRAAGAGSRLMSISAQGTSLRIEASEPVPYVATRPDPLTLNLDLRNVEAGGVSNKFAADARGPIAAVAVETIAGVAGVPASRIHVSLLQPLAHRVRSERNTIVVEFERGTVVGPSAAPTPEPARRSAASPVDPIAALGLDRPAAASAAPAVLQGTQVITGAAQAPGGRKYTGTPVSFDFEDVDLRAVLRLFQDISGLNIVIDPDVKGSVNLVLRAVPWDQALDVILKSQRLGYVVEDTIVRISSLESLRLEEEERRKLEDAKADAGELLTATKRLSYAKAEELQGLLKSVLSRRGSVQIHPGTNTLIVTDLEPRLKAVEDLIGSLDRAQPQVEIEARIIQTNRNYARQLGVSWGFNGRMDPALGNTTNLAFPNSVNASGRTGGTQGPNGTSTSVNLPVGAATSAVGLALGSVNGAFNLDVALSALEASGNGRILSTPRVSTLNNVEAEMTQGVQIPLQTISNNTVTVDFRDAALTLKVTPQITASDTVIMKVALENSTPDFSRAAGPAAIPPINTQRALTTLLVNDGQTTVIGGIYTSNQQTSKDGTPGLSSIPIISWLFKREGVRDESNELLIFITPRIIR